MPVSAARKIAYDVLRRVEAEGAYATDVLHTDLGAGVRADDAALATEIALGVLRWRGLLDFLLQRALKKPVERLDLPVAIALRMGLYQLRFLERIPARAAVNESAELVKSARKSRLRHSSTQFCGAWQRERKSRRRNSCPRTSLSASSSQFCIRIRLG
jgi:16S rRNA (cytosine967-C5)-methyltransferase